MARTRAPRDQRAGQRPSLAADRKSRLYVPQHMIPNDKVWRWVAETVQNAPNDGRVQDAMMSGWTPVDGSKYEGLMPPTLPGREKDTSTLVRKGGQILMELDKWKYEERVEDHEDEVQSTMNAISTAVDGQGMQDDDRLQVHGAQTKFDHRRPIKQ